MITPQNISVTEVLALAITPAPNSTRLPLQVRTWDRTANRWTRCTDGALTARAETVARDTMTFEAEQQGKPEHALYGSGDTVFLGAVDGTRVLVEVK